jgi:hypothetical protein
VEPIGKPIEKHPCLHEGAYALCVYCPKYKDYILWGACRQCSYNSDGVAKLTNNPKCLYELTPTERSKKMKNINKSKVLLDIELEDSLQEGNFNVKITRHFSNIVLGECVEVKIEHTDPELCLAATYQPGKFPEDFYRDLDLRGWDFVLAEMKERL